MVPRSTISTPKRRSPSAQQEFTKKNPTLATAVDGWTDGDVLNKAKLCIGGKITRTAIILLGRPESDHFSAGSHPQLTWILKDRDGMERDYKHFGPPFLLAVDPVLAKVRNLTCRVLPWGTLFPVEVLQYDPWVLRETLHNAIAHQDYSSGGRINVVEFEDRLVIVNCGAFLPGDVESVIRQNAPLSVYRNAYLAQAMVGLQMIDTIGSGIKRIFECRRKTLVPDARLRSFRSGRGQSGYQQQGAGRTVHPDVDGAGRPRFVGRDCPG